MKKGEKKGRKITKRLRGPVSLLLVLDEKHKRYPRGSAMQQAGVLWHLKGWRIGSGRAEKVAKLLHEREKLGNHGWSNIFFPHHWDMQKTEPMTKMSPEVSAYIVEIIM